METFLCPFSVPELCGLHHWEKVLAILFSYCRCFWSLGLLSELFKYICMTCYFILRMFFFQLVFKKSLFWNNILIFIIYLSQWQIKKWDCSTQIHHSIFIFHTVKAWNSLKYETKNSQSVNEFKTSIDKELHELQSV